MNVESMKKKKKDEGTFWLLLFQTRREEEKKNLERACQISNMGKAKSVKCTRGEGYIAFPRCIRVYMKRPGGGLVEKRKSPSTSVGEQSEIQCQQFLNGYITLDGSLYSARGPLSLVLPYSSLFFGWLYMLVLQSRDRRFMRR